MGRGGTAGRGRWSQMWPAAGRREVGARSRSGWDRGEHGAMRERMGGEAGSGPLLRSAGERWVGAAWQAGLGWLAQLAWAGLFFLYFSFLFNLFLFLFFLFFLFYLLFIF